MELLIYAFIYIGGSICEMIFLLSIESEQTSQKVRFIFMLSVGVCLNLTVVFCLFRQSLISGVVVLAIGTLLSILVAHGTTKLR